MTPLFSRRTTQLLKAAAGALALALPLALTGAGNAPALALGQGAYTLEVLVDGRPLRELWGHGRTYVEARAGREYSLRLTNNTGERVAITLSVDGLNSIDAKTTTAVDGSKWILGPYESITLDGWQTSSKTARRFFFTTEEASYGAWLGKTSNLGVISAAVFRERVEARPVLRLGRERSDADAPGQADAGAAAGSAAGEDHAERQSAREPMPSAPAPPAAVPAPEELDRRLEADLEGGTGSNEVQQKSRGAMPAPKDEYAATGIGREVEHPVDRVHFDIEPRAVAALEIRYEYRDALVKLGVLMPERVDPLRRREHAHGFEGGFAPDPYRSGGN